MLNLLLKDFSAIINNIALIYLLISALKGLAKGFAKTIFSILKKSVALGIAIVLSPTVINYMQDNYNTVSILTKTIFVPINNLFGKELMQTSLSDINAYKLISAGISGELLNILSLAKTSSLSQKSKSVGEIISMFTAYHIHLAIITAIIFILTIVAIHIIIKVVNNPRTYGPVFVVDKLLGLVLGLFCGIIIICSS